MVLPNQNCILNAILHSLLLSFPIASKASPVQAVASQVCFENTGDWEKLGRHERVSGLGPGQRSELVVV